MLSIPESDLAHIKHETPGNLAESCVLLVSTPRSGSTMLCTDLDLTEAGAAAEYCQPFEIIPYLMQERPEISNQKTLNLEKYAQYLITLRSGSKGKLFLNIHARHIPVFNKLEHYLPPIEKIFLLFRKDVIAQGISYYVASKTGAWSNHYANKKREVPPFSYTEINAKIVNIISGCELNIKRFSDKGFHVIYYESYLRDGTSFAAINKIKRSGDETTLTLQQSNKMNEDFKSRYYEKLKFDDNMKNKIAGYDQFLANLR